jgi:molybdate transport system regulatory protein
MELSARNQLRGVVKSVRMGAVMSEVIVDVGGQEVVAAITARSTETLQVREGAEIIVVIKATDVMLARP